MSNTSDYETQVDAGHAAGVAIAQSVAETFGPFLDASIKFLAGLNERWDRAEANHAYEYEFANTLDALTRLASRGYRLVAVVQGYGSEDPVLVMEREVVAGASASDAGATEKALVV